MVGIGVALFCWVLGGLFFYCIIAASKRSDQRAKEIFERGRDIELEDSPSDEHTNLLMSASENQSWSRPIVINMK